MEKYAACKNKNVEMRFFCGRDISSNELYEISSKKKTRGSATQPIEEVEKFNEKEKKVEEELIWHYYPYSNKIFVLMNLYNHKPEWMDEMMLEIKSNEQDAAKYDGV